MTQETHHRKLDLPQLFAKLDTTQEGIVKASSLIMKHAKLQPETTQKTVDEWCSQIKKSAKPLALVYLANDLIQRSKIKNQTDFCEKFQPLLPDVFELLMGRVSAIDEKAI